MAKNDWKCRSGASSVSSIGIYIFTFFSFWDHASFCVRCAMLPFGVSLVIDAASLTVTRRKIKLRAGCMLCGL